MIYLSHPTGNANVRAALEAFDGHSGVEFFTTVAFPKSLGKFVPVGRQTLERRSYPIDWRHIHLNPWREVARLMLKKFPSRSWSVDVVYQSLDRAEARRLLELPASGLPQAVYAYEDGAFETFQAATRRGVEKIYDLPTGYYPSAQEIFKEEASLNPAWASTISGCDDSPQKLARKAEELARAHTIMVASSFSASTIKAFVGPGQKIVQLPYGTQTGRAFVPRSVAGRLKVLYVGRLTQMKGLSYLFEAVAPLRGAVDLTIVGRAPARCEALSRALVGCHVYESLSHESVLELMGHSDILVFPSLFEGFGLVLTEALSCGLPFIATPHTAAPDLISDGKEGFIVPIRNAAAITDRLVWALDHRHGLWEMQRAAYEKAQTLGWVHYRQKLVEACVSS